MSGQVRYHKGIKVSEHHGTVEWTIEKIALAILMPLGVWAAWSIFTLAGTDYQTLMDWFANRLNAGLLILTLVTFFLYVSLAWKVIIEDYIHKPGTKGALLGLVNLICLVLVAAAIFFIVRLALGSAPLPAGFGV